MRAPLGEEGIDDRPPVIRWPVVIGLFVVSAVLRFAYFYLDDLTRQVHGTFVHRLIEEGTGNFASALLFPIAVLLERRFPLDGGRWRRTWLVHVAGYVVYSIAHTTVIAATRAFLFPLLGHGAYDYGILAVRYPMEAAQDFFSYATFVGVLTLIRVSMRLRAREVRSAELERDAATARLEALRLRLQPHFLFNALHTISSTVYQDPVTADELIGHLGELLRQSLRASDRPEIRLDEELELVRAYQALIEARFGDRVRFSFDIAADMDALAVPAFLLQPLIENAVEHGASLEYGRTDIRVAAARRAELLEIVVENDSDGEPAAPYRFGTGLGTTRDRLDLLYAGRASLETRAEAGQFRVVVRLPARQMESLPAPAPVSPRHARADR